MLVNKLEDLKGCLNKKGEVCFYCLGQLKRFPTSIHCSMGNECGRGVCCFHKTETQLKNMFAPICEYCGNEEKSLLGHTNTFDEVTDVRITIEGNLRLTIQGEGFVELDIKFCPICGKDLKRRI